MLTKFSAHCLGIKTSTKNDYGEDIVVYADAGRFDGWLSYINYNLLENQGLDLTDITHECLVKSGIEFHIGDMIDGIYEIKFFQDDRRYTKLYLTELKDREPIPTEQIYEKGYVDGYDVGYGVGYEEGYEEASPVKSVNGYIGDVWLEAEDVGALPIDTPIPSLDGYATEEYVDNAVEGLASETYVDTAVAAVEAEIPSLDGYATETYVDAAVATEALARNAAIGEAISGVVQFDYQVVQTLPSSGIKGTIYLVPKTPDVRDIYDEYIWVNNDWEHIGTTAVDLSDYYDKDETDLLLLGKSNTNHTHDDRYYTETEVDGLLDDKQDTLTAGTNITIYGNTISADKGSEVSVSATGTATDTVGYITVDGVEKKIAGGGGGGGSYTFTNGLTESGGTVSWDLNDKITNFNAKDNIGVLNSGGFSIQNGAQQNLALVSNYPAIGWATGVTRRNIITGFNNKIGNNYNQTKSATDNFIGGSSCGINSSDFKKNEGGGSATNSIVFGEGLLSCSNSQAVFGRYNEKDIADENVFILGNGTSSSARSNALTVSKTGILTCANIPPAPTSDGNYVLKCSIVSGAATYSWVAE